MHAKATQPPLQILRAQQRMHSCLEQRAALNINRPDWTSAFVAISRRKGWWREIIRSKVFAFRRVRTSKSMLTALSFFVSFSFTFISRFAFNGIQSDASRQTKPENKSPTAWREVSKGCLAVTRIHARKLRACHPVNARRFPPREHEKKKRHAWTREKERERERTHAVPPGEFVNGHVRKWHDILRVDFRPAAPLPVSKEEDEENRQGREKKKEKYVQAGKGETGRGKGGKDIKTERKREKEGRQEFQR